jgi:hypothetical protein
LKRIKAEEISKLAAENAALAARVFALVEAAKDPAPSPTVPSVDELKTVVAKVVYEDAHDRERRRNNIIVSGLPTSENVADTDLFTELCVNHLHVKPLLIVDKCRRIDKPCPGRTPRLRIVFANSDARDSVLRLGRSLKNSTDPSIRAIYLNPDLTPVESAAAFEARQRRRASRTTGQGSMAAPSAASADPASFRL